MTQSRGKEKPLCVLCDELCDLCVENPFDQERLSRLMKRQSIKFEFGNRSARITLLAIFFLFALTVHAQTGAVETVQFRSQLVSATLPYHVILPPGYRASRAPFLTFVNLGFRFAPPEALCFHPLRGFCNLAVAWFRAS